VYRRKIVAGVGAGLVLGGLTAAVRERKIFASRAVAAVSALDRRQVATASSASSLGLSVPVTREELGQATWTLLHTMGAQFPEYPTRRQRRAAASLIRSLEHVYPCHSCAKHWGEVLRDFPPRVSSGSELRTWLCQVHNVVNQSVGNPRFDCQAVEKRWGTTMPSFGKGSKPALCGDEGEDYCRLPGRR